MHNIINIIKEECDSFINEINVSNKTWYHGTDKNIKGELKKHSKSKKINTTLGDVDFNDFLNAFFVTDDYSWAEFYAPKTKNVYEVKLKDNAKILDASNIVESTHINNTPLFGGKNISNDKFPFQEDLNQYAFRWLNKKRMENNRNEISYQHFKDNFQDSLDPSSENWNDQGLSDKIIFDYIMDNNYDAVYFKKELAILNLNIIESFNKIS